MTRYQKDFGQVGEDRAAGLVESKNFTIVARNFRFGRSGEIDIIAEREGLLVFIEVKARSSGHFGGALYSINQRKKKSLRFIAERFLQSRPGYNTDGVTCRFDMIAFDGDQVHWIEDIFR